MDRIDFRARTGRHITLVLLMLLILLGSLTGQLAVAAPEAIINPFSGDLGAAARLGEELFGRNCQQCHNSRGKGGKGPQLVRGAWGPDGANSDAFMYRTIKLGRPHTEMGSFALILEDDEIWQIISFLREEAKRVKAHAKDQQEDEVPF